MEGLRIVITKLRIPIFKYSTSCKPTNSEIPKCFDYSPNNTTSKLLVFENQNYNLKLLYRVEMLKESVFIRTKTSFWLKNFLEHILRYVFKC